MNDMSESEMQSEAGVSPHCTKCGTIMVRTRPQELPFWYTCLNCGHKTTTPTWKEPEPKQVEPELVEKVAKICGQADGEEWDRWPDAERADYSDIAADAIRAVREHDAGRDVSQRLLLDQVRDLEARLAKYEKPIWKESDQ